MKQIKRIVLVFLFTLFLYGCQNTEEQTTEIITEPNIESCDYQFDDTYGQSIVIEDISIPHSKVLSNTYNFISPCKEKESNPLVIIDSSIKTHQIIFSFDAIYPVESLNIELNDSNISKITIFTSLDGLFYDNLHYDYEVQSGGNVIDMKETMVKSVKILFDDTEEETEIQDVEFILGEGFIIKDEIELTNYFIRNNGWTGADGIFTFDLDNGGDSIGVNHDNTGFIFSDTFIGDVTENNLRTNFKMINNTFSYLNSDDMTFVWDDTQDEPNSVLLPNEYIGQRARNLLDGDGLNISNNQNALLTNKAEGTMWLSTDLNSEIIIDLKKEYSVTNIYLWNYNAIKEYGVKEFNLYTSLDGINYGILGTYNIDMASGLEDNIYQKDLIFNENITRYIKIEITDTYSNDFVGLGKIMLFDVDGNKLFGEVKASNEITEITQNEESARLWLQDGIIINNKVYIFPILVKDYLTYFQVHNVGLIEMDILNKRFDYNNAKFLNTPLMSKTADGGIITFGAGVLDNRDIDGYIYIYGYKDIDGGRFLTTARVTEENFLNFNEWTYYTGTEWSKNIDDSACLKEKVSAELSVTYINSGMFKDKYMLVVMENTTSGNIVFALSDTPYGTFSEYTQIYKTTEKEFLNGAFTYNAKLHPNLSTEDKLIISYNVNTTSLSALRDARIYYPRFISITEVKKED